MVRLAIFAVAALGVPILAATNTAYADNPEFPSAAKAIEGRIVKRKMIVVITLFITCLLKKPGAGVRL